LPVSEQQARALRQPLAAAMREAGALAMRTYRSTSLKSWTKAGTSPVSEADIAVDRLLRERLGTLVPEAAWLSEETDDDRRRLSISDVWVVDPIDGTRAYISGLDDWTISVALVRDGRPLLAALYAPVSNEMFLASRGSGAHVNERPLAVTPAGTIAGASFAGPQRYLDWVTGIKADTVTVPKIHSLALRLARVAEGAIDAAFTGGNSHDWDLAAADLLVHEAGGALTDFHGRSLTYNAAKPVHSALVAAGPARHAALVALAQARDSGL
jgi:myo-inositol-1(or 4)-monophosphatase